MNPELLEQAEALWDKAERAYKFQSRFELYPDRIGRGVVEGMQQLAEMIPDYQNPQSQDAVYETELKRRLQAEALYLEHFISGNFYTFDEVIQLYGIDAADITSLREWLLNNREPALEAIDRVFDETEIEDYQLPLPAELPNKRREAAEFTGNQIRLYHQALGTLFASLTGAGDFLRDIDPVPSENPRSYFQPLTRTLALGISTICYITADQTLHINEAELLRLFGHEGMGHGVNKVITDRADTIPPFLKRASESTRATVESVAQFYENQIFEDLSNSPDVQRRLDIAHKFFQIRKEHLDTQLIQAYQRRMFHYAITVLADKQLGDMSNPQMRRAIMQRKIDLLKEVALSPRHAVMYVERSQHNFDSQGNLDFNLASELVYAAQPAERVHEVARGRGLLYDTTADRNKIDMLLLTGYWTPIGLVENASTNLK